MANLNGKWALTSSTNMDAFLKASGVTDENRAAALPKIDNIGGLVEEYFFDPATNKGRRNIYQDGVLTREGKGLTLGVDIQDKTVDGREVSGRFDVESPNRVIRIEKGAGYESRTVIECTGDTMKVVMTCGDVQAERTYKKQ